MKKIDCIGHKYGMLTIIKEHSTTRNGHIRYVCQCDCGNISNILLTHLRSGKTKSCGCQMDYIKNHLRGKILISDGESNFYIDPENYDSKKHIYVNMYDWVKIDSRIKQWKGCGEISGEYWAGIKKGASGTRGRKKIDFDITIEYAWNLFLKQDRKCALSDLALIIPFRNKNRAISGNASLDRIDSSKGYIENNVQWVHKDINMMKRIYNQDYFISMCELVVKKNKLKNEIKRI